MNPRISLLVLLFFIAHGMDMGHFRRHTFRDPYCSFHGLTEVAWQAATKEFYVCLRRVDVQAEFNYKASRIATLTANDLVQVYGLPETNEVGMSLAKVQLKDGRVRYAIVTGNLGFEHLYGQPPEEHDLIESDSDGNEDYVSGQHPSTVSTGQQRRGVTPPFTSTSISAVSFPQLTFP